MRAATFTMATSSSVYCSPQLSQTSSHIEIKMTEAERGLPAYYLVLNAGIPIDQVPPELRAGGASY